MENTKREGGSGRLKTLPLLLCQVWPQYRMIRILYLGLVRKSPQWRREQKVMLENVSGVEPFIESVPQCLWVLSLGSLTRGCVGLSVGWGSFYPKRDDTIILVYATSVVSASYGVSNFLRVGPLKVIPNQPASGLGHPSFYIVFFSVSCSLFLVP